MKRVYWIGLAGAMIGLSGMAQAASINITQHNKINVAVSVGASLSSPTDVSISQTGAINSAVIGQSSPVANTASIRQSGALNTAKIGQSTAPTMPSISVPAISVPHPVVTVP